MRKNENSMNIEGKIYQFNLEEKVTGENSKAPGTHYIAGTIDVATDESLGNIVQVHYSYVAPTYSSGKTNNNYTAMKRIIDSAKTVLTDGYAEATSVRLNPSFQTNDFYPQGQEEPVCAPRNEGGFVTLVTPDKMRPEGDSGRNKFSFDMVISNVAEKVPDEGDEYVTVEGIVFNYNNTAIYPITLTARNKDAMKYFVDLGASKQNPVYTKVWGKIVNIVTTSEKTVESAFGEAAVEKVTHRKREYVITGANPVPYEFDTAETITADELKKALQDREVYLASEKKRTEEWRASQGGSNGASPAAQAANTVSKGSFNW
jgi:hypothetical protein